MNKKIMSIKPRIAIVISHPIQHFCPQYASFARQGIADIKVFFASVLGYKKYHDKDFGHEIAWNNLYLDEFEHEFLNDDNIIHPTKDIDAERLDPALELFAPDLLIIYGYYQKLQRRAHAWGVKHRIPLAYISDSERKQKRNVVWELVKYPFLYRYFSGISYFFTVGNANEAYYKFYGVTTRKIMRMHFPIDKRLYENAYLNKLSLRKLIRDRFNVGNNEIVLSVVGKLVSWKSQQHIIEALQLLENSEKNYHLFIIGSGPMLDDWKKVAALVKRNTVHFIGFVKPEDLPAYYAATDIYIHPAAVEPHSLSISEAIFMGCPVIVSNRCGSYGTTDDVQEGKNGFIYKYGDIKILSQKIDMISSNSKDRNTFSAYSHNIATSFQERSHRLLLVDLIKNKLSH